MKLTSYFKVTNRQIFGFFLSIIISCLWWWQMIYTLHNGKDMDEETITISKYQWCGLLLSIVIGLLSWFKTVNIVDK
jgi:hypothetical protein